VVVAVIDKDRIFSFEEERQAPVPVDPYGPVSRKIARERMQLPAGQIHILGRCGCVESRELTPKLRSVGSLYACLGSELKESLKSFVSKVLDHTSNCIALLHAPQHRVRPSQAREIVISSH
jgi:hypothetical protein